MTDLTPEQIDQYADDRIAERHWQSRLDYALRTAADYRCKVPGILHAHAKMLRLEAENAEQQATIERLKALLQKVVDDTEIGVVPRSHLDRIEKALQEAGEPGMSALMIDTERKE